MTDSHISKDKAFPPSMTFKRRGNWLQSLAYRVCIELRVFILTACLSLAIAMITASYQALKAALSNPVDALRYE